MKKILLIDNFDSFTFNLVDLFRMKGCQVKVVRNTICKEKVLDYSPDLIVFSPGPGSPEQAGNMIEIIKEFASLIPMFGVCLGHQAIVLAFGGSLKKITPFHGKSCKVMNSNEDKTLLRDLPNEFEVGRYHSLAADLIPSELEVIAVSLDKTVMALKHKDLPVFGVQFHPESILTYKNKVGEKIIDNLISLI